MNADALTKKVDYMKRRADCVKDEYVRGFSFLEQPEFDQLPLIVTRSYTGSEMMPGG